MKRTNADRGNADRGGGGLGKRQRNSDGYAEALAEGKFELRFLLPTKCAGAVIGRGGEKIKAIREKYSALLTVPDKSTSERVFTMVVAQESLTDCFQEVLANLSEFKELKNKKEEFEIRILIHQSMAGAIIGRKGEKIKELREQTGANLKVFSECAPMSTDRVLLISAPQEKLPEVVKQMIDFMKEIPIKGVTKQYDAVNYDPRMAATYGGYPSGNGSGNFNGPPPHAQRNMDPFDGRGGFEPIRGQAAGYGAQPAYGNQPGGYGDYNRQPYGGGVGAGGNTYVTGSNATPFGSSAARGPPPPQMAGGNGGYDVSTTQVTIPDELAGTIIGKGGERINRIRQDSGARIDVGSSYGNNERIITITGTPHQIQSAQYYLQQSVRTSEAGRRYLQNQR